jgi:hypothetical protein
MPGLWNHDLTPEVYSEIQTTADEVGIAVIFKTTTKMKLERNASLLPHDAQGCAILKHCSDLSWTANMSEAEHYWDDYHFTAQVNRMFNEQLLELLRDIGNVR